MQQQRMEVAQGDKKGSLVWQRTQSQTESKGEKGAHRLHMPVSTRQSCTHGGQADSGLRSQGPCSALPLVPLAAP